MGGVNGVVAVEVDVEPLRQHDGRLEHQPLHLRHLHLHVAVEDLPQRRGRHGRYAMLPPRVSDWRILQRRGVTAGAPAAAPCPALVGGSLLLSSLH